MYVKNTTSEKSFLTDKDSHAASEIEFTINNKKVKVDAGLYPMLLQAIREELNLTGTKYGCGEGQCGTCTVLLDGKPVHSCIIPTISAANKEIITIEGLSEEEKLHPVQQAFIEKNAMQCGYCTSGMILTTVAFLKENPNPDRSDIVENMNGNLCRCGNYTNIITAIQHASKLLNA